MRFAFLALLAVSMTSCAVRNTLHVHPATGDVKACSASGWGWIGAPMALTVHGSCTDTLKSIGYLSMDEVTPGILSIESSPPGAQIFTGPTDKDLRVIGVTPMRLVHPQKTRAWAAECFQVRLEGYLDSKIDCRPAIWGDRAVAFTLTK